MHTPIIDGKVKVVGIPDFPWICGDELCFVFRNFPLTKIRPHAYETALAAEAAAAQGKFWDMYDYLFKHGQAVTNDSPRRSAASLGLNLTKFDSEFHNRMYRNHIDEDIQSGNSSGVKGTPTFFINGQCVYSSSYFKFRFYKYKI